MTLYLMGLSSVRRIVTMIFTEIPLERVNQCHTVGSLAGPSYNYEKHHSSPTWHEVKLGMLTLLTTHYPLDNIKLFSLLQQSENFTSNFISTFYLKH